MFISAAATERISVEFHENFMKICRENSDLVKIGQKYGALYMKIQSSFYRCRRFLGMILYQAVRTSDYVMMLVERLQMNCVIFWSGYNFACSQRTRADPAP
jgi:hypothetical protein